MVRVGGCGVGVVGGGGVSGGVGVWLGLLVGVGIVGRIVGGWLCLCSSSKADRSNGT